MRSSLSCPRATGMTYGGQRGADGFLRAGWPFNRCRLDSVGYTLSSSLLRMSGDSVSGLVGVDLWPLMHSPALALALITGQRVGRSSGQDSVVHLFTGGRCSNNARKTNKKSTWASSLFASRRRHWPTSRCRLASQFPRSWSLRPCPATPLALHRGTSVAQFRPPGWLTS